MGCTCSWRAAVARRSVLPLAGLKKAIFEARTTGPVAKAVLLALALGSVDLALSACWAVCLDIGRTHAGVVTGCMNTFSNLGGVLTPLVVAYAVEQWQSWTIPFYVTALVYAAGAATWLAIDPTRSIVESGSYRAVRSSAR